MISKEELKVVNVFRKGLFREFSVKDIMNETKKNSYNWVFNSGARRRFERNFLRLYRCWNNRSDFKFGYLGKKIFKEKVV